MITQSPRTEHLAAHVTPEAKKGMYTAAAETGKSMSLIMSELVDEYLKRRANGTGICANCNDSEVALERHDGRWVCSHCKSYHVTPRPRP